MDSDNKRIERRRTREIRLFSQMVVMHCDRMHKDLPKTHLTVCGGMVCDACARIDANAAKRKLFCRKIAGEHTCENCQMRCYRAEDHDEIRAIMAYSGPRMIVRRPLATIMHMMGW